MRRSGAGPVTSTLAPECGGKPGLDPLTPTLSPEYGGEGACLCSLSPVHAGRSCSLSRPRERVGVRAVDTGLTRVAHQNRVSDETGVRRSPAQRWPSIGLPYSGRTPNWVLIA